MPRRCFARPRCRFASASLDDRALEFERMRLIGIPVPGEIDHRPGIAAIERKIKKSRLRPARRCTRLSIARKIRRTLVLVNRKVETIATSDAHRRVRSAVVECQRLATDDAKNGNEQNASPHARKNEHTKTRLAPLGLPRRGQISPAPCARRPKKSSRLLSRMGSPGALMKLSSTRSYRSPHAAPEHPAHR